VIIQQPTALTGIVKNKDEVVGLAKTVCCRWAMTGVGQVAG